MRDIFTILVVGCIGANAAVNYYDLLGRRGSEMNSPMVYKDIDYTKLKKKRTAEGKYASWCSCFAEDWHAKQCFCN